ncbi:MAG: substrate-binding domain-containing protein [Ferruginibacter sp.]
MKNKKATELSGIKEIARRARVSIATVDRVIHKRPGVSSKTRDKINRIIFEMNYQPNLLARRLASRKIIRIATLIPQVSAETSFWEAPLSGIYQAELEIIRYGIKIEKYFFDQHDQKSFLKYARVILKSKPDGVLLAPSLIEESIQFTNSCKKLNIPFVFINSDIPNQGSLCYIGPNLYQSGYLAADLVSYLINKNDKILIVNISKEMENHHHLLRKEEGFRAYFKNHKKTYRIVKIDIKGIDSPSIKKGISGILAKHKDCKVIFVTNSRVSHVANYLEKSGKDILLIGYDFLKENINYLDKGVINFLICQKPEKQAYLGIMALYKHLLLSKTVEEIYFMPIDIITKENYSFYGN